MLPRHFIPLALGLAAFAVAEAASEGPRAVPAEYAVSCAAGRIEIGGTSRAPQHGAASCVLDRFDDRAAAERFARDRVGGPGSACGCD